MEPDAARSSYDVVAETYAGKFSDELSRKPLDREWLERFARDCPRGRVLDIGCGPGHVGRFLADRGLDVTGIDLSPAMVDVARRLETLKVVEPAKRQAGIKVGSVDELVGKLKALGIAK